ncbi:unnamed protein product [Ceutorhynchus assimilis]|uniref:RRM domain-containing protein n=1 Tax=Ceutorhynchus assimilis TaxID=467358 RepID=A0A9P0DNA7_9CUCU|nr:unnamed protein product [Ceutorhynchus assimilis]
MNNSRSNSNTSTPPPKFNFSQPPPGWGYATSPSVSGTPPNRNYPPPPPKENKRYLPSLSSPNKSEHGYGSPETPPYKNDSSRYSYYQGSNMQSPRQSPNTINTKTPPPTRDQQTNYHTMPPPPLPVEKPMVDQRLFAMPPPPPPTEQYPPNLQVPPANMPVPPPTNMPVPPPTGFILSSTVYAFPVQNAPPVPPIGAGPAGAAGYMTHNQQPPGNYRHQSPYQGEYRNSGYSARSGGYNNQISRKRNGQECDTDSPKKNSSKKKKKPLSQNMPSKKDWSVEDAKRALDVEREYNKRHKSPSLIIKFPDVELNREIVSKFHPKIESVHFQQPSTPRFCFVTLRDSACIDEVINEIRKIKFGDGFLTAEPKNNREDDVVKGPEDIDPLTLYVGNLAQEVTVDDVHKAYPKHKRIDIGFAKKMKYTRYAFVSFRNVDDAIESFQSTHSTEMYNKSLIVRFRRLHGTVGLPGDPKPQNPAKNTLQNNEPESVVGINKTPLNANKLGRHSPLADPDEFGNDYELESEDNYTRNMENIFSSEQNNSSTDWSRVTLSRTSSVRIKDEPLDMDPDLDPDVDLPLFDDAGIIPRVHTPTIEPRREQVQVKQEPRSDLPLTIKEEPSSEFPPVLSGRASRGSFSFNEGDNVSFQF